jgi:mannitol/fructose-specific phosphotransferase system IIA component (Ntr-type)
MGHWDRLPAFALEMTPAMGRNPQALNVDMTLADILNREQIVPEMNSTDRWQAIDELIDNLVATGKIKPEHRESIAAVVKKRETSMSTGIGFGIGIPHASTDLIHDVVGAFGRSKAGVNFDALDNQPVHLVMLFLVPQGQFQKHLHTLAGIAKLLHNKEFRQSLEQAPDGDAMHQIICKHAGAK